MQVLLAVVCLLAILTAIVVVHEAGHAVAARLCGARVTEFFVGMPWGPEVSRRSSRSGIRYGATLALLGGYTKIAGMVRVDDRSAPLVLALVNARGRVSVDEVAQVLGCEDEPDGARAVLEMLADWGSIREVWPTARAGDGATFPTPTRPSRATRGASRCSTAATTWKPPGRRARRGPVPAAPVSRGVPRVRAGADLPGAGLHAAPARPGRGRGVQPRARLPHLHALLHAARGARRRVGRRGRRRRPRGSRRRGGHGCGRPHRRGGRARGRRLRRARLRPRVGRQIVYEHEGERVSATAELGEDGQIGVYYPVENRAWASRRPRPPRSATSPRLPARLHRCSSRRRPPRFSGIPRASSASL